MAKYIKLQNLTDRQLKSTLNSTLDDLAEVLMEMRLRERNSRTPAKPDAGPSPKQIGQTFKQLEAAAATRKPRAKAAPAIAQGEEGTQLFAPDPATEKLDAFDRMIEHETAS